MGTPASARTRIPAWQARAGGLVATVVQLAAVFSVVLLIAGGAHGHVLNGIDMAFSALSVPTNASLVIVLLLVVLGSALRRRKKAALYTLLLFQVGGLAITLVLQAVLLWAPDLLALGPMQIRHIPMQLGVLTIADGVSLLLIWFLLKLRPAFPARLAPGAWRDGLAVLFGGLLAVVAIGWGLTEAFPGTLGDAWERFAWAVNHATGENLQLRRIGVGEGPAWIDLVLDLGSTFVATAALYTLFRGVRSRRLRTDDEELRLRRLLAEFGDDDSLGYFATRRDKSVVFARSGRAAVTYRVLGGTSVASADPVGDPDAWPDAVRAWLDETRSYGWVPGVLGASERGAKVYAAAGLRALEIGDEAVLDVREFSLSGPERKSVRQAVKRIERAGYTARVRRHGEIPEPEMQRLLTRAQQWRGAETERGFSMALGRLGDPSDARNVMVEAYDAAGELRGLLSFVPWGRRGLSLDLMRRDRDAENGLNEFMVAEVVAASPHLGAQRISLNFAMFRAVFSEGERIGAGPVLRLWRSVLGLASRFFQLESLYRSNAKYGPDWEPRFLCYSSARRLPRVSIVAGALEGFVPTGRVRVLRHETVTDEFVAEVRRLDEEAARIVPKPARRPEQVRVRVAKLDRLRELGIDPYPVGFSREDLLGDVTRKFADLAPDSRTGHRVRVAGRVLALRTLGGLCFARIKDFSGEVQLMLDAAVLDLAGWRTGVDLGDHVGVSGEVVTSRRGELSVLVDEWTVTAKCLHPLPDKRKGLIDPETRVRQRYLDLAVNPESAQMLRLRSTVVRAVRERLHRGDYLEVETPMLQTVHGGANARPFVTHINAYDMRMYLRIAPELYLKRLCVAGVERVFELNRNFRNEGVDATHNPEFTMLEAYQAYADYNSMRDLTRELVQHAAEAAFGEQVVRRHDTGGHVTEYDISGDWPVIPVHEAVSEALGEEIDSGTSVATLRRLCHAAGVPVGEDAGHGDLVLKAHEHLVEGTTVLPTFYTDYPTDVSPLTRRHRGDPLLAERWDLIAFGSEVGTAYTELTDPIEQRRRLETQSLRAASGDVEAMELDEDFLLALEHGMPPTGGLGLGIDRLLMMLSGASIRQTVLFPFVRPHA
ncbi:bifunctional lysylphosphatidylglycerol synthetase/lysine--tRNA ligase LysX [Amycolatopsis sp. FDAARGOS 1241]|uniref:bifunctional lysylphosphatidylglycerol synthetase/lysine--tRNA ligase LysX n=1 Tax=Amycolatopsis sp. FDAARGOS 1241 TaxID=2778070 RepID=UPI00194E2BD1|nr:bifunctional lysylphosphatidylglycerol synthetase/lysine--tRNA ligase LysX [Amycolatopsis sp. FDAARGOS 1241]QRP44958.1 bifunctional lysylphosphatidylglycerol synthetase/lysine--tRNA ligase LysX [Amycolatopsis sp. FDAARGOS 1241]